MTARPRPGRACLLLPLVALVAGCVPARGLAYERHLATVIEPISAPEAPPVVALTAIEDRRD